MIKKMSQLSVRDKPLTKTKTANIVDKKEQAVNKVDELLAEDWSDDEPESQAGESN